MKVCLSQIPESERGKYIREIARNRVLNKLNNKYKTLKEKMGYERV